MQYNLHITSIKATLCKTSDDDTDRVSEGVLTVSTEKFERSVDLRYLRRVRKKRRNRLVMFQILLWFYSFLLSLARYSSFLIVYTIGRTPWTGDQPVARSLPTHRTTQTQNKSTQTSIPPVGFEPTISVLEWAKAVIHRVMLFES
jgi:hypothetical protein